MRRTRTVTDMTDEDRLHRAPPFGPRRQWLISIWAIARYGTRCGYCGTELNQDDVLREGRWQLDHLWPKRLCDHNGNPWTPTCRCLCNAIENLVNTCTACNTLKGTFDPYKKTSRRDRDALLEVTRNDINAKRLAQQEEIDEMKRLIERVAFSATAEAWVIERMAFSAKAEAWVRAQFALEEGDPMEAVIGAYGTLTDTYGLAETEALDIIIRVLPAPALN